MEGGTARWGHEFSVLTTTSRSRCGNEERCEDEHENERDVHECEYNIGKEKKWWSGRFPSFISVD